MDHARYARIRESNSNSPIHCPNAVTLHGPTAMINRLLQFRAAPPGLRSHPSFQYDVCTHCTCFDMNASAPATHVPVSPVQPAHELYALYSGNVNRIQEELASFKDDGRFSPGKHTVLFAQPGDSPDLPLTQNAIGSMFYPHTANLFR